MTIIIGAGMAGLLAAAMLRTDCKVILEAAPSLPNNHSALLRFRSDIVGNTIGVPFKPVNVMKSVIPWRGLVADALAYSKKSTGTYALRSSLSATGELETRFIAPPDLVQLLYDRRPVEVLFDYAADRSLAARVADSEPIISTMPMPALMELLGWEDKPEFRYCDGLNISVELDPSIDLYITLYVPNPEREFGRVSITGNKLVIECPKPGWLPEDVAALQESMAGESCTGGVRKLLYDALYLFGIDPKCAIGTPEVKRQRYAKILPIDERLRKKFMMWATDKFSIYSLGRFATWRPGLLLDDVVNDVRVIQGMISNGNYQHRKG